MANIYIKETALTAHSYSLSIHPRNDSAFAVSSR